MTYGGIEINTTDFRGFVVYIGDEAIEFSTLYDAKEYIDEVCGRDYDKEPGGIDYY